MASIIIGSAVAVGYAVKHRKDKKARKLAEKEALTGPPDYSETHGRATVVSSKHEKQLHRQQKEVHVPDLPSYDSVVAGRELHPALRAGDEKPRRSSEDGQRQ